MPQEWREESRLTAEGPRVATGKAVPRKSGKSSEALRSKSAVEREGVVEHKALDEAVAAKEVQGGDGQRGRGEQEEVAGGLGEAAVERAALEVVRAGRSAGEGGEVKEAAGRGLEAMGLIPAMAAVLGACPSGSRFPVEMAGRSRDYGEGRGGRYP